MAKGVPRGPLGIDLPPELVPEIRILVYEYLLAKGEKEGVVYKVIKENPTLTLNQLRWKLEHKHKIPRSNAGIKRVAISCNLPYVE
jgi:hypothetical protein